METYIDIWNKYIKDIKICDKNIYHNIHDIADLLEISHELMCSIINKYKIHTKQFVNNNKVSKYITHEEIHEIVLFSDISFSRKIIRRAYMIINDKIKYNSKELSKILSIDEITKRIENIAPVLSDIHYI